MEFPDGRRRRQEENDAKSPISKSHLAQVPRALTHWCNYIYIKHVRAAESITRQRARPNPARLRAAPCFEIMKISIKWRSESLSAAGALKYVPRP